MLKCVLNFHKFTHSRYELAAILFLAPLALYIWLQMVLVHKHARRHSLPLSQRPYWENDVWVLSCTVLQKFRISFNARKSKNETYEEHTLCIQVRDVYLSKLSERECNAKGKCNLEWRSASKTIELNVRCFYDFFSFLCSLFSLSVFIFLLSSPFIYLCVILI